MPTDNTKRQNEETPKSTGKLKIVPYGFNYIRNHYFYKPNLVYFCPPITDFSVAEAEANFYFNSP